MKMVHQSKRNKAANQELLLVEKQENAFSKLFATMSAGSIIYNGITAAMNGVQSAFRNAVDFAYELDEAYTNINQTMTISKSDFEEWVDEATKVANSTGTLTGEVLTMMKTYASAGETIDNINAKLAGTTAFQNVTGLAAAEVTNSVQSIMNQYKLAQGTAEEIADSMQYLGDVMGGLTSRRGILQGQENVNGVVQIRAEVPLSEMFGYATDLRSFTQGRGNYTMTFFRYEEAPKYITEQIIKKNTTNN